LPPSSFHFERLAGWPSSTIMQSSALSKYRFQTARFVGP
jgi:hypothetical protein